MLKKLKAAEAARDKTRRDAANTDRAFFIPPKIACPLLETDGILSAMELTHKTQEIVRLVALQQAASRDDGDACDVRGGCRDDRTAERELDPTACVHAYTVMAHADGDRICAACGLVLNTIMIQDSWATRVSSKEREQPGRRSRGQRSCDPQPLSARHIEAIAAHYAPYAMRSDVAEVVRVANWLRSHTNCDAVAVAAALVAPRLRNAPSCADAERAMRQGDGMSVVEDPTPRARFACVECGVLCHRAIDAKFHCVAFRSKRK